MTSVRASCSIPGAANLATVSFGFPQVSCVDLHSFHPLHGLNSGAPGAGCVSVGHYGYGDVGLFGALGGHAFADFAEEPFEKRRAGFYCSSAYDEDVGVERIDHLVEK